MQLSRYETRVRLARSAVNQSVGPVEAGWCRTSEQQQELPSDGSDCSPVAAGDRTPGTTCRCEFYCQNFSDWCLFQQKQHETESHPSSQEQESGAGETVESNVDGDVLFLNPLTLVVRGTNDVCA